MDQPRENEMGQGTDSCGGYDVEYEPHVEGLESGDWTQSDGTQINVKDMTTRHLANASKVAERLAESASCEDSADAWMSWVRILDGEIDRRSATVKTKPSKPQEKAPARGRKVTMICHCGAEYKARAADIERGWALSCSKRCAAIRREFGRPPAKAAKS